MHELMTVGFKIDGYARHELNVFLEPEQEFKVFCSKRPRDVYYVRPLLTLRNDLWVIYMLRDPRDVIVSTHRVAPDMYFSTLSAWKQHHVAAQKVQDHPRFITVKYEELVTDPDGIQRWLHDQMPFLKKRVRFSEYHEHASPSSGAIRALGGVRPISAESVGAWRDHKPRVLAQLQRHGSITDELIALGYEDDDAWLDALSGIQPENGQSRIPERISWKKKLVRNAHKVKNTLMLLMGIQRHADPRKIEAAEV
jgi:hypothetical protein